MTKTSVNSQDIRDATITDADIAAANKDGASGTASLRTLGTGAAQAAAGNDARLGESATHVADTSAAHAAASVAFTPVGTIAATDVQAAIAEVASEAGGHAEDHDHDGAPTQKLAQANTHETPDTDVGPTSLHHTLGTGANQAAAGTDARFGEAATHVADGSSAHAASAVAFTPNGSIAATDVQAAIQEVRDEAAGGGAPSTADYLVGTADGGLSAEIVVGTTPGGELGGTWASPTVDATHSGSTHGAAVTTHEGAADPHTGYLKESDFDDVDFLVGTATGHTAAEIVVGTTPGGELGGTWASPTVDALHSGSRHDVVYVATPADTAINSVTDITIATNNVLNVAAGDQLLVDAWFVILNNSTATRVYNISLDFDGVFPGEIITGALATSATLMHSFQLQGVFNVRSTSLTYGQVAIQGNAADGVADDANRTMAATDLFATIWGTQVTDVTGTVTVSLLIRSANATATQTCRLLSFTIRKVTPT